jgi:hypothetical protein
MAAELQPQPQLAVVGQQGARAAAIDQPAGRGEVPGEAVANEGIGGIAQQLLEDIDGCAFLRPPCRVFSQRGCKDKIIEFGHVASQEPVGAGDYRRRMTRGACARRM